MKDPATGYYDPRDPFTALPKALIPEQPYASFLVGDAALAGDAKPLKGMRIAILREHMVKPTQNHEAICDQIDRGDQDGAARPARRRARRDHDAGLSGRSGRAEPAATRFADALSELLPRLMPEIFTRKDENGRAVLRRAGLRRHVVRLPAEAEQPQGAADRQGRTSPTSRASRRRRCAYGPVQRHRCSTSTAISSRAATRGSRTGRRGSRTRSSGRDASRAGARELGGVQGSPGRRQGRPARAQPHRAPGAAAGDVRERHRRVRAPGEHGADAEDPGAERRHRSASTASRRSSRFRASSCPPA